MDAPRDDSDPIVLIERAVSELRRAGRRRFRPDVPEHEQSGDSPAVSPHRGLPGNLHGSSRTPWAAKGSGHEHPFASMARYRLISTVDRLGDGASISELAEAIGVDQPRASRVVADAIDRGLVSRAADPDDARRTRISLSDAGRQVLTDRRRQRRDTVERALDGFSAAERDQFAALLGRFVEGTRGAL